MKTLIDKELMEAIVADRYSEDRKEYCVRKEKEGFKIWKPEEDELFLDIDTEEQYLIFKSKIKRIEDQLGQALEYKEFPSSTKTHYHIVVTMPLPLQNNFERIALQLILGSDPVKEMLSLFRCWQKDPFPILLARKRRMQ